MATQPIREFLALYDFLGLPLEEFVTEKQMNDYYSVHEPVPKTRVCPAGTYTDIGLTYPEDTEDTEDTYEKTEESEEDDTYEYMEDSVFDEYTGKTLTWGTYLEDYPPIQAIGESPRYYGPLPPPNCSDSRWRRIATAFLEMQGTLTGQWIHAREPHVYKFYSLMNSMSSFGCYLCEYVKQHDSCYCECEGCGDTFCRGCTF